MKEAVKLLNQSIVRVEQQDVVLDEPAELDSIQEGNEGEENQDPNRPTTPSVRLPTMMVPIGKAVVPAGGEGEAREADVRGVQEHDVPPRHAHPSGGRDARELPCFSVHSPGSE